MMTRSHLSLRRPGLQITSSLSVRLALIFGLISALTLTAMGLSVYFLTEQALRTRALDDLSALASFYAAYTAATAAEEDSLFAFAPQIASFFAPQGGYDVRLFSGRTGSLLAATRDIGQLPSRATLSAAGSRRPTLFLAASQDLPDRLYAAQPVSGRDGQVLAVVEVSRSQAETERLLSTLRLVLLVSGVVALLLTLLASALLAQRLTRPLRAMEQATGAIAKGDFDRRLAVDSADEIGRLAASINDMAADLARLEASQRDFIAKVSHDLRTPLTAIKGFVVNLQDGAPDDMRASLLIVEEQVDRLSRLVTDLLTLSRMQRGELQLRCRELDLADVAQSAVSLVSQKAEQMGIALALELPEGQAPVHADADRLQQATANLLDNALRATPAGGRVSVRVSSTGAESTLIIADSGSGLEPEEATRAFEPYFRGPGGGSGLGLTIAREIVAAHGGRIWLENRAQGGAEAGFALPKAEVQARR